MTGERNDRVFDNATGRKYCNRILWLDHGVAVWCDHFTLSNE